MKSVNKEQEPREFVDKDHSVMMDYYELLEKEITVEELETELKGLIEKDPLFFDSYSVLSDIYENSDNYDQAKEIQHTAYKKAIKRISKKGVWPDVLEWGWMENRHIIRAILRQAIYNWSDGEVAVALDLFRKLFACNLRDNIGARYYILAIRLGLGYKDYVDRFESEDHLSRDVFDWFDENSIKFPEEFKAFNELEV